MDNIYNGVPTLSLLPLTTTQFKVVRSTKIIIPREGVYNKLAPKIFDEGHGSFNILDNNILYLPSITKVLLATNKYPVLKHNQVFSPYNFEFTEDQVTIQGSVLEIISIGSQNEKNVTL